MARERDYRPGFDRDDYETDDLRYSDRQFRGGERQDFGAGSRRSGYVGSEYEGTGTVGNRGGRDYDDSYRGGYGSFSSGRAPYGGRGYEGPGYGGGDGGGYRGRGGFAGRGYRRGASYDDDYRSGSQRDFWDRAGDEVSSWFGDEDAERRRRMDQFRGRGPKGYTRSDDRIKEDVNDRLTDDWSLDASDIEVDVGEGEVTLSGEVSSRADKRRAEDIAETVSGVRNCQNNIRVRQSSGSDTMTSPSV